MSEVDTLKEKLVRMPRRAYGELLRQVEAERREELERQEANHPAREMSRDEFAEWIARRNYDLDAGISRIFYFPTGAPSDEVRLLECNELLPLPDSWPIRAYRIEVDAFDVDFKVYLTDTPPGQLPRILAGQIDLPPGWLLDGYREFQFDDR